MTTNADDGTRLVEARVRAQLLGLPLLRIDARLVIGHPDRLVSRATGARLGDAPPDGLGPAALSEALRLLDEGERRLGEVRRLRQGLAPARQLVRGGRRWPRRTPST